MDSGEMTYRQQRKYCGKARCRKCRDGIGHGPYWFAVQTVQGKTVQTYIGKQLPPEVQAAQAFSSETTETAQSTSPSLLSARQVGRAHQRPLVGRATEQQAMLSLLRAVEQGTHQPPAKHLADAPLHTEPQTAQCVLLLGEAGIGKTRLAEEVGRFAHQRGWIVLWGRTYLQESAVPYHLWIEVLHKAMTVHMKANRRMLARNAPALQPLLALLPELKELLPLTPASSLAGEQEQHRLWEAVYRLLTLMSERAPLLIILDDVHWADESSGKLLAYLVPRLKDHALMVIATCREHELSSDHPLRSRLTNLRQEHAVLSVPLSPLSNEQIGVIISAIPHLSETIVQRIQAKVAGNPLFAEELARAVDPAFIAPGSRSTTADTTFPLPDTIAAVLDQRMERLSRACQQLLGKAAVLGNSFEFPLIEAMEARSSTGEDTVLDLLDEALQAGVLREEEVGPRITYHFWHPLLASHLYNELSAARRANLHRQAAGIFRQAYQGREDEGAAMITYHLVRGGTDAEQIVHYAGLAGDRAYRLSAYTEAEHHYRQAVEHLEARENIHADQPDTRLHLASLLERLAECTMILGNYEETRRLYERLLTLRSNSWCTLTPDAVNQEAQREAMIWCELGWTWRYTGDAARAHACRERGEQVLRDAKIVGGPAWASLRYQYSSLCWQAGSYAQAFAAAQEALTLFEDQRQPTTDATTSYHTRIERTLAGDPVNLGRIHTLLAALAATVGKSAEALAHLTRALAMFEQDDHQREIAIVSGNLGDLYLRMGKHPLAHDALQHALTIAERIGDRAGMSVALGNLGILAARSGDLVEAESYSRRAIALAEHINDPVYISLWHAYMAIILFDQGRPYEAGIAVRRALTAGRTIAPCTGFALIVLGWMRVMMWTDEKMPGLIVTTENNRSLACSRLLASAQSTLERALVMEGLEAETTIEGQIVLAQIALLSGDGERAGQLATYALQKAEGTECVWLIGRAYSLLGSILEEQDHHEQAEESFTQAMQVFRESGMRLEYARVLQSAGVMLLQRSDQRGLEYLQEARQVFGECHARRNGKVLERLLATGLSG